MDLPAWMLHMQWRNLLFLHWPVQAKVLRPLIPAGLDLDLHEEWAWLGIAPFAMRDVRPRWLPALPGVSAFPELNVRTYVRFRDEPGVWFFSLDAGSALAVKAARRIYRLPYYPARMRVQTESGPGGKTIHFRSARMRGPGPAEFEIRYGPTGPVFHAGAGSLEHWLTQRLRLYAAETKGSLLAADIAHAPWPLQSAWAEVPANGMTAPLGFPVPSVPPLLHFARHLEVKARLPWKIASGHRPG